MAKDGRAAAAQGMVPSTYVRLLYEYLERRGLDAKKLLQSPPPEAVDRGLGRYPVERWRRLLEKASAQLDDPLLGLHLGRSITPAHFGVIGYVLLACGNLGAALHTTPRTLHRRLERQDCNFRSLRERTRQRLAEDYLRDPRLRLAEIAQLLGFSEQSAFSRSFRRWTGQSPNVWRRAVLSS